MTLTDPVKGHRVYFSEETNYITYQGVLLEIDQKVTLETATLYGSSNYECHIVGDGTVQHWGVELKDYEPATITVNCVTQGEPWTPNLTE